MPAMRRLLLEALGCGSTGEGPVRNVDIIPAQ
jgi:hypothetical protein